MYEKINREVGWGKGVFRGNGGVGGLETLWDMGGFEGELKGWDVLDSGGVRGWRSQEYS